MRFGVQGGQDAVYDGGKEYTRRRKEVNGRTYMAADKSPLSPGHLRVYSAAHRDLYERLARQGITWWEYWGPEIVLATRRLASFNGREADGPALADHLEDAAATSKRHWMIHTIVPGRPLRSAALLDLYARVVDQPPGELSGEIPFLLAGAETIQTRLVEELYDLACLALEAPEIAQSIALGSSLDRQRHPQSMQAFTAAFQRLIAEYGDRLCYRKAPGFPVELPLPWREDPEHVWELIASYLPLARQGGPGLRQIRLEALGKADERVNTICAQALNAGKDLTLVEDFRHKLAYARRNAGFVDEHNHYIDQVSEGQYVQALLYAGRWLAALGTLPDAFDVFWLYMDEVLAALREPLHPLNALLDKRRVQFGEWLSLIPPACLGLPDPRLPERARSSSPPASPTAPSEMPANTLVGEPASRGRTSGRARIVVGNSLPADLASSDVIVAPYAGSQLIPFLPAIAAVVLDYGGPGDHFAITAREFGLPAVCATLHAVQRIPESAWVTVDAYTGLVTWTD
jgi:phosphohistidine swiveling domain-containing protein